MALIQSIALTRSLALRPFKLRSPGDVGFGSADAYLLHHRASTTGSSISWAYREYHDAKAISPLFSGHTPNYLRLVPVMLSVDPASEVNANVYAYFGPGSPAQRVCSLVITAGSGRAFDLPDGRGSVFSANKASSYWAHGITITDFWGPGVRTWDTGATSGFAGISFDLWGATHIVVQQTTALDNGTVDWFCNGI